MTPTIFVLVVNPAVSAILAAALFVLWRHQRELGFVGLLSLSFALKTAGFVAQFMVHPDLFVASRFVSNTLFLGATVTLCAGMTSRHGLRPPYPKFLAIAGLSFAGIVWWLLVQPSYQGRVVALNTGVAASCFLVVWRLLAGARRNAVERMLVLLVFLYGAAAFIRQTIVLLPGAPPILSMDSSYWVAVTATDLLISLMLVLGILSSIALDVFDRLREESERDALSGLYNRRGFMERAAAFVRRGDRGNVPATILLADLDRFKSVNDTHGHDAGDRAIEAFAAHLTAAAGDGGVIGRLGGEEFVIFLPISDAAAGRLLADGIRASFSRSPLPGLPEDVRLTASFGVAELGPGERMGCALRRADVALYAAKASGRDCTVVAPSADATRTAVPLGVSAA